MIRMTCRAALLFALAGLSESAAAKDAIAVKSNEASPVTSGRVLNSYHAIDLPLREKLLEEIFPLRSSDASVPTQVRVTLPDLGLVTLELTPVSLRSANFTLRLQKSDGTFETVDPGPESTYTGRVLGQSGSTVAASIIRVNLFAMIRLASGETYWIQPLWDATRTLGLDYVPCPSIHLVYRASDTLCTGECSQPDVDPPGLSTDDNPIPHGGCGTDTNPCIAEIKIDADFEYFQAHGTAVQERIAAIINVVNHQFQRDVHVTHRLLPIMVRQAEPDPYTTADATGLLFQVKAEWIANGGGMPRDLVQLFTGRDLNGSDTGAAFDAAVCDNDNHYSLVQSDFSPLYSCVTDNTAHFLGHLWGASHCNCPTSTMNPTLSCANSFTGPGATSVAEINGFLESATCLGFEATTPANDRCDQAIVITASGAYISSNVGASTDGAATCGSLGGGPRDIFWTFTPATNGPISVRTCGTFFDTILSVHTGCPATPVNLVSCNDDCTSVPLCFTASCLTFNGVAGQTYYVRVSGFVDSNVGPITLTVTLCAGDLDCDDDRDPDDIPDFVQALVDPAGYAASHPGCPIGRANINGDSTTDGRDVAAFTALLMGGACP